MAAIYGDAAPWEYWRVQFCEKGVCDWDGFDALEAADVQAVIAVWDGIGRVEQTRERRAAAKGNKGA